MARNGMKAWRCQSGHVLGQVARNGSGVRQLLLYRQAVDDKGSETMEEVDVMAVVQGLVLDVRCSICQRIRTWQPGEEGLRQLLRSYHIPETVEITENAE